MKEQIPWEIEYFLEMLEKYGTQLYKVGEKYIEVTVKPVDIKTGIVGKAYHALIVHENVNEIPIEAKSRLL